MNGAVPKADFVRGQNRLIGGNHVKKNSWFRDADVGNTAVGMQKGKTLFTTQHQVAPQPAIDQETPARQIGGRQLTDAISTINKMTQDKPKKQSIWQGLKQSYEDDWDTSIGPILAPLATGGVAGKLLLKGWEKIKNK